MTDHTHPGPDCASVRSHLDELALGVLPGDERAAVLAHVEDCPNCQAELDELTTTADGIVSLVPAVEPSAGFEQRVLATLGSSVGSGPAERDAPDPGPARRGSAGAGSSRRRGSAGAGRSRRRVHLPSRRWLPAAAAVALVAAGFGGWAVGHGSPSQVRRFPTAAPGPLVEASLMTHGTTVGRVFAYWDNPGWVFMSIDDPGVSGQVTCELVRSGGTITQIGWFQVRDGKGYWGAPIPFDPATVHQARLVDEHGQVIASARL